MDLFAFHAVADTPGMPYEAVRREASGHGPSGPVDALRPPALRRREQRTLVEDRAAVDDGVVERVRPPIEH